MISIYGNSFIIVLSKIIESQPSHLAFIQQKNIAETCAPALFIKKTRIFLSLIHNNGSQESSQGLFRCRRQWQAQWSYDLQGSCLSYI